MWEYLRACFIYVQFLLASVQAGACSHPAGQVGVSSFTPVSPFQPLWMEHIPACISPQIRGSITQAANIS